MTEPFKSFGITIFTYDITGRQIDARHGTVSLYEGADLALPVRAETTMVYEDDGHGSAVLREIIWPNGQVEKVPPPPVDTTSPRYTTTSDEDGRVIDRSESDSQKPDGAL